MNVKTLIAAVTLLANAGAVFAGDVDPFVDFSHVASSKTRAEVTAEMRQAAAKGEVTRNIEYVDFSPVVSGKTRAEVIAEMKQAAARGEVTRNIEHVDFTHAASTRTREEVRNEARLAARSKAPRTTADVGH